MVKILTSQEIEVLDALKGKQVSINGYCAAQDENGVAKNCPMASYNGVLTGINYDPITKVLKSVTLESRPGQNEVVDFDLQNSSHTWDLHRSIYHQGNQVLEASSR